MLRINLLPDYIHSKNKIRNLGIGWGVAVFALALFLLFINKTAADNLQAAKDDQAAKEQLKSQTDGVTKQINDEKQRRADIETKQKFVVAGRKYNDSWAGMFEVVRDVTPTDASIILKSLYIDPAQHKTVSIVGFGKDEATVINWWKQLRSNPLFDHVNFDTIPKSYTPQSALASAGGPGGFGGPMMGGGNGPGSGGTMSAGNKLKSMQAVMTGAGAAGLSGGAGRGAAASDAVGPGELRGKHGLNFTATIVFKEALDGGEPAPGWPAGGGGGGGAGIMGGGPSSGMGGIGGKGGAGMGAPSTGGGGPGSGRGKGD